MATKYLKYFPKPVLDDLVSGRWLPVIGAGMSLNARLPPNKKMPLWPDMGKALDGELADFTSSSTLDAISAYQHEFGRVKLIERLSEILYITEAQPGEAHKAFCAIPFDIVCTTNFDFLLERQYDLTPRYVYPVVDEEQLSINSSKAGTLLLKLHGDIRHPSRLIVTEEDYDSFLSNFPLLATYLSNQLITKTAVFIGYSLDDPDFRQIWNIVSERLGRTRRMAYSVMVDARIGDVARYERRGVKVINIPGSREKYGEILADTFRELHEYLRENVISVSQVKEEEPLRELLLPRGTATRLCFFSIPVELLSLYRSRVFPMVEELGFVPVTADDVLSPGDNINAKIDALIDRAAVMVVELSSQWTRAEYDIAVAKTKNSQEKNIPKNKLKIIVIVRDSKHIILNKDYLIIRSQNELIDNEDHFIAQLENGLRTLSAEIGDSQDQEARRLLDMGENRAAVISAMSLLEATVRKKMMDEDQSTTYSDKFRRPLTLYQMFERLLPNHIIPEADMVKLKRWIFIRNEAVHLSKLVTKKDAKEIVDGVYIMTNALKNPPPMS